MRTVFDSGLGQYVRSPREMDDVIVSDGECPRGKSRKEAKAEAADELLLSLGDGGDHIALRNDDKVLSILSPRLSTVTMPGAD